jgi:hypothetical protein
MNDKPDDLDAFRGITLGAILGATLLALALLALWQ